MYLKYYLLINKYYFKYISNKLLLRIKLSNVFKILFINK